MRSVQAELESLLVENSMLQFGLSNRLFNLSQLAKHIRPSIEARAKKEVSESALVMALSRCQRDLEGGKARPRSNDFSFRNIQVSSNLCIHSYEATAERRKEVVALVRELQSKGRFVSFTHGLSQISLFFGRQDLPRVKALIPGKPIQAEHSAAVVGCLFEPDLAQTAGFFHTIFQQLYIQGVNILEVASTFTELLIYVEEKDMRLAFDTLYSRFVRTHE
jgi:hypothetical protein